MSVDKNKVDFWEDVSLYESQILQRNCAFKKNSISNSTWKISIHQYVKIENVWNLEAAGHYHRGQKNLTIDHFGSSPYRVSVNFF